MNLIEALQQSRQILDAETDRFFNQYVAEMQALDPTAAEVADRLHEYSRHSGKAARPLLVAVGAALSQEASLQEVMQQRKIQLAMLVIELTHKRILMADDVSDQDEQRHGAPSFHVKWEQDLDQNDLYQDFSPEFRQHIARSYTEVAGIIYQNLTYYLLADEAFSDTERRALLISLQKHTYDPTPAGWFRQFLENFHSIADIDQDHLVRTFELITGEYSFVNPLQLGALLGPNAAALSERFVQFGYPAGVLFQITDDLIGVFGSPEVTGKPVGNDFREGKKSLMVQYAFRQASPDQQDFLQAMIGNQAITGEETAKVTALIRELGGEAFAREQAEKYAQQALQVLQQFPDGEAKQLLEELTQFILVRDK